MVLAGVAGLSCLGLLMFSWMLSSNIMHPSYVCNEDHFIYCGDPSQLDLPFEDISFQPDDSNNLSGWYIPAETSDKAIIFVHGHGADRHEGMRWFKAVHEWANLDDLYGEIIEQHLGLPSFPLAPLIAWMLEQRTGMDMAVVNPENLLGGISPRPVFIIHCSGDNLIGFSHGERNYAAANTIQGGQYRRKFFAKKFRRYWHIRRYGNKN